MSLARHHHPGHYQFQGDFRSFENNHSHIYDSASTASITNNHYGSDNHRRNHNISHDFSNESRQHYNIDDYEVLPSLKRRKYSATTWENRGRSYNQPHTYNSSSSISNKIKFFAPKVSDVSASAYTSTSCKRGRTRFEDGDAEFLSRDEIERFSPSRKDGIDVLQETHLRYSYCAFLQNLGLRLELPQTTIGTAMVLCHRFFVRRSHASHDRFLIATAALFLAAKSEETPCPLNNMLRASSEIFHKQDFNLLCYQLPLNWFEQYRERAIEAEQMILTTLNFELNVQHPYASLTSILEKLGLAQSLLVNLALSLVSEGAYKRVACMHSCMILLAGGLICCSSKVLILAHVAAASSINFLCPCGMATPEFLYTIIFHSLGWFRHLTSRDRPMTRLIQFFKLILIPFVPPLIYLFILFFVSTFQK